MIMQFKKIHRDWAKSFLKLVLSKVDIWLQTYSRDLSLSYRRFISYAIMLTYWRAYKSKTWDAQNYQAG